MANAKIMVVEDETIVAMEIQKVLKSFGYVVPAFVSSGEEAIQKAAETRPDLVLMDIKLQGDVNGVAAAEQIRARFDIPVIYLTAYADEEILQRAKVTEPYSYILKPFEERELHATIEVALHKHKAERALQVSHRFLQMANRHTEMNPLLREFVAEIKNFTGCAAVGIRILDEEGNIPYQVYEGFSQEFYESENPLSIKSDQCICINVIKGEIDIKLPFRTEGGSFYMNCTTRFLATTPEEVRGQTCNMCNKFGYESVALVPIRAANRILGLIHVADPRENMAPRKMVELLEAIAMQLGAAIQRVRAEEEKEKMQAQLLQAQKMEAIGTLAGGMARDFNNLLATIQGYAQLAMMEVDEENPLYRNLKEIHSAAVLAADLTRLLLLFSRSQPMEFAPLNINETIDGLLKTLNRFVGENIAINTELELDPWMVMSNVGNIEQIILNLAVNARDAMPEGGKLTIRTENVILDEEHCKVTPESREGKFVRLSVSDTGVGMDKETIGRIFEPFFTTKAAKKGTGLGLAAVYGIVKQHEGWINVYSKPGIGSTIMVYLPAVFVEPEGR